ncbi:FHF complex subunit HOOK interacting protein 2A-like isoform X2 [Venturia canescens]|uniref:FHF complex subunit HOOK interacting protein 2A-like isoform X2 n=1 Tax=Venturia canescens TaxID=32260 RepID=UPI001C9C8E6A|nr:FHF complex subunit HOOK interacting protein 2A-like isoform X2 [Venturia canescens]
MLRRFRASKLIAPPATPLQDFTYHWKQLMNFYASHETDCKVSIENTGIPRHLDRLLEILLEEERRVDGTGPCLEYLLQHGLLDWLSTLAIVETPPGMRLVCFSFLKRLLARSKHPLLHHAPVHAPVQRLISQCNGNYASPVEAEEIQFLLTLCFLVCKYPQLTSIVNDSGLVKMEHQKMSREQSEKATDLQSVTYVPTRKRNNSNPLFEPLNTQAVTLVNPNLFANDRQRRRSVCSSDRSIEKPLNQSRRNSRKRQSLNEFNESHSAKDTEFPSQSSSPLSLKNPPQYPVSPEDENTDFYYDTSDKRSDCRISLSHDLDAKLQDLEDLRLDPPDFTCHDFATDNEENTSNLLTEPPNSERSGSLLLDALISYVNSADNMVRIRACEGIMVLAALEDTSFAVTMAQSDLPKVITRRLNGLFKSIPAHVDPGEIDAIDVTWGLDSPLWTNEKKFPGCRQVAAYFVWLDYCDQLIKEAHHEVARVLAKDIRRGFFDKVITSSLADHHAVLITALLTESLKKITSPLLCTEISHWLVGDRNEPDVRNVCGSCVLHTLIENCYSDSDDLTLETLKLFEEILDKRNEHVLHCLVLSYLTSRGYYDNGAADSAIGSWSDEEDEREREKKGSLDFSQEQSHSRTLAPSNIHRIINCFLSLMPRQLQTDSGANHYERYMADWEKQYAKVRADCALLAWPLEAVTVDDSASYDSRPEADHCSNRFYMGPFISMLFDKVVNIPNQRYEINLQLTVVISRLALLPHPYLHEYLLNPLLPLGPGLKSLFTCLQKVIKQLSIEVPKDPKYKQILKDTRKKLLEDSTQDSLNKENILYESVIIMEEFCKELAAISYVKYNHSM